MRFAKRPTMAPKYGDCARYPSRLSKPKTMSASFPERSGVRMTVMMAPYVIARTSMPWALVSVNSSTEAPSGEGNRPKIRSEEHTSELQSHHDLVCRLLLE